MLNKIVLKYFFLIALGAVLLQCANKKSKYNLDGSLINSSISETEPTNVESIEYKKQTLTATEFIKWCADENNHLNKSKEMSEFKYNLAYMPVQSLAYLELRTEQYDEVKFQKACEHYTDMTYFNLKIELPNGSGELLKYQLQSPRQYEDRVKYISFNIQNDIYLVQKTDTLNPGLCQYERIFEVAPYATVMMAFDSKKFNKEKEFTIVFNDKLFNKGFIKFNYKNGQLINVPNIIGL